MGGNSRQPFLSSLDLLNKANEVLEHQGKRRLCNNPGRKQTSFSGTRPARVLFMKRRPSLERRQLRRRVTRPANQIERKVKILKKLIPNCSESGPLSLDNLFRETADYISALQLRVKVMQIMVDALSGSN